MRRSATLLVMALLALPAWDCLAPIRINASRVQRLRERHRDAPDTGWDHHYAELVPYLPETGRIGLVQAAPMGTRAEQREYYFLQYALAPRLIVPGAAAEYVIACAPRAALPGLLDLSRFALVRAVDDEFGLYRRIRP
jgi:hypothetical protein